MSTTMKKLREQLAAEREENKYLNSRIKILTRALSKTTKALRRITLNTDQEMMGVEDYLSDFGLDSR